MKITNLRTSHVFEGEHIDTIPGGSQMTNYQLKTYLNLGPLDKQYPYIKRATKHKRMVLLQADGTYAVIPTDERFWKVEK